MKYTEDDIISLLKNTFPAPENITGIGDDCAVISQCNINTLITTDSLVEGVHFLRDKITPFDLGYKSIMVNVSDIAAMGGTPLYCFCSLSFPVDISADWIKEFTQGIKQASDECGVSVLGGDTTASKRDIFINVSVVGEAKTPKYRHRAGVGDVICTTGTLGDSKAGLDILLNGSSLTDDAQNYFIQKHNSPKAHVEEGKWLGACDSVTSMMDISDGLITDIKKLVSGSEIALDSLPMSDEFKKNIEDFKISLQSGEEYDLLLTVEQGKFERVQKEYLDFFHKPLYRIGKVIGDGCVYTLNNKTIDITEQGYEHF